MGGRIPKSAQRAIDKANRESAARLNLQHKKLASLPAPRRLSIYETPRHVMNMHDVFFDGELQKLCAIADVDKGMIMRFTRGVGNRADHNSPLEKLQGKVEIKPRKL